MYGALDSLTTVLVINDGVLVSLFSLVLVSGLSFVVSVHWHRTGCGHVRETCPSSVIATCGCGCLRLGCALSSVGHPLCGHRSCLAACGSFPIYVGKNPAARGLNPSLNPFPNSRLKLAVLFSISFLFHIFFRSIRHLK